MTCGVTCGMSLAAFFLRIPPPRRGLVGRGDRPAGPGRREVGGPPRVLRVQSSGRPEWDHNRCNGSATERSGLVGISPGTPWNNGYIEPNNPAEEKVSR